MPKLKTDIKAFIEVEEIVNLRTLPYREQIEALEIRLVGTEAENGWLDTRYQNLQTEMEVLKKERDSLLVELQRWMERFGSVGALRPRS